MKDAQHDEAFAIESVAKDILRIRHLEHKLAVLRPSLNRTPDQGMFRQDPRLVLDFGSNNFCKARMPVVKKSSEPVEIGQSGSRPLEPHWPFQDLK